MRKKFLATLLCAAMTLSMMAGCGAAQETAEPAAEAASAEEVKEEAPAAEEASGEVVMVSMHIPALTKYADEAVVEVEEALNDILEPKYGINIDLTYIEMGNFTQSINLAMTTDEVDVTCFLLEKGNLDIYVKNGQLLDITDYFNNSSAEFQNLFNETERQSAVRDGRMYGVPRKYQYGGFGTAVLNKDIVEALNIDAESINSMETLGEVLYQVHEAYPDIYALVPQTGAEMTWMYPFVRGIGGANFLYTEEEPEATELKSVFETDSFKEFCSYTRQWYLDGLIMPDAISNTIEGTTMVTSGAAFCTLHNADIDPLDGFYPNTVQAGRFTEAIAMPAGIGNLQYGISKNSAHPDEAFKLLEAVFIDEEVATTLIYGIKGKHWDLNEDGRAVYAEGVTAENNPYGGYAGSPTYPNYLCIPAKDVFPSDDMTTVVNEWNNNVKIDATVGFAVDLTKYADFSTAYANIEEKYFHPIYTGTISLEETLPAIIEELEGIGYYETIAEIQKELDEFIAQK